MALNLSQERFWNVVPKRSAGMQGRLRHGQVIQFLGMNAADKGTPGTSSSPTVSPSSALLAIILCLFNIQDIQRLFFWQGSAVEWGGIVSCRRWRWWTVWEIVGIVSCRSTSISLPIFHGSKMYRRRQMNRLGRLKMKKEKRKKFRKNISWIARFSHRCFNFSGDEYKMWRYKSRGVEHFC